ncbi:GGDEF domain-containing protein [Laribacter hongkongensis]|uniref:GGDEF domain-containing protein n=1 Tax=Laribacter hongkongensis TaxID=168471 RepID=UPI001EFEEDAB|nr:diguanylate cyclase [Laribacter hongkongensis]MCG9077987.1 diguanylate cyclase [Laribacter hongkongensis]
MSRRQLMQMLFDEYAELYLGRDPRLLEHFSHDFSGYTGCGDFLVQDVSQWHEITRLDFSQVPEPIRWEMQDIAFQDLADTVIAVTAFFHIHLPVPDAILASETARLVLIFRQEADGWKVAHSGISLPYRVAARAGEVYPLEDLHNRNRQLEALIESRTRELEDANRRLEKLSRMDGLTGIANRRTFDLTLKQEWRRAQRRQRPLSLVMLDVDHFKSYNDGYGHLAGDEVLITLARILAQQARRAGDLAARYGGEEFVLLLPDCLEPAARQVAENVRTALHERALPHHGSPWGIVTVSLGVAGCVPQAGQTSTSLLQAADAALYQAKQAGRDSIRQVAVGEGSTAPASLGVNAPQR